MELLDDQSTVLPLAEQPNVTSFPNLLDATAAQLSAVLTTQCSFPLRMAALLSVLQQPCHLQPLQFELQVQPLHSVKTSWTNVPSTLASYLLVKAAPMIAAESIPHVISCPSHETLDAQSAVLMSAALTIQCLMAPFARQRQCLLRNLHHYQVRHHLPVKRFLTNVLMTSASWPTTMVTVHKTAVTPTLPTSVMFFPSHSDVLVAVPMSAAETIQCSMEQFVPQLLSHPQHHPCSQPNRYPNFRLLSIVVLMWTLMLPAQLLVNSTTVWNVHSAWSCSTVEVVAKTPCSDVVLSATLTRHRNFPILIHVLVTSKSFLAAHGTTRTFVPISTPVLANHVTT
mmetsp:Transcript_36107/g.87292  ORF Transcript_36107/g.87292 Transcript_36107/m.87292 type:complete len:340 (+) Transcript_36107:1092-2111(+)